MRIIYFDIDCLRPDHLGCYGYDRPTSPAIDSIATEGTRFTHYYCGSSPCLPSRTALMSGRFGIRNGVLSNYGAGAQFQLGVRAYGGPEPENEMVMRHLRRHGYDTIAFSNFADRHSAFYWMCGWSEFHTPNLKAGSETAVEVNEKVLAWLKHNAKRDDYYLHINYWDTHRTYKMQEHWADRFRDHPVTQAWPDETAIEAHQQHEGWFTAGKQFKDDKSTVPLMPGAVRNRRDFEHMVTGYDASIAYVDAHVQEVLDELARQGVLDDAVIIVSSDHGDAFGEHGIYSDHVCADECIHRIPLIVRAPRLSPAGHASEAFMYNLDFAPTLCDLLGIREKPQQWDGTSYLANIRGESGADRDFLVWDTGLYTVQRCVRTKRHLYIRTYHQEAGGLRSNIFRDAELYDMEEDYYQANDIAEECPEIVNECQGTMDEWMAEQKAKPGFTDDPLEKILAGRGAAHR